ncbi:MAG: hypothetical protein MJE77_17760 [Proteobacteria bacterium]|nr:hypothetical protein [Pseudomonadota bacterium]
MAASVPLPLVVPAPALAVRAAAALVATVAVVLGAAVLAALEADVVLVVVRLDVVEGVTGNSVDELFLDPVFFFVKPEVEEDLLAGVFLAAAAAA